MNDSLWGVPTALGSRIPLASLIQTLAVAEHLNFRHAANALGVSLSSISARIKALEEDLGILLFERHARGVRLTDAGRRFVEGVAAGVDQLDHAVKTAGMVAHGECGRLRVGIHALIPHSFLAELIERYREYHPGIEVEMTESTARDALIQLRADRLDIVFLAGTPELPDCHSRQIWTEPLVAAVPDQHPLAGQSAVTWADLAGETFLVRHGGTGPQAHDHILLRLAGRWPAHSILRFDVEHCTLLSMIGQGFGITIVAAASSLLPTPGVVFLPVTDEPEPVAFSAVWSPFNQGAALHNLLDLANKMGRSIRAG
ncbi:LysR family transcriptional regulator [Pseudomonas aeruginosa]|nr:LysR family transcriptional regulator [Pseudomonas aeruginosa]EIU2673192.1 LysR family transcriptional regulator [Pseudomonas aeruginosa]EIU2723021.1 LysR family transcriptional regulator [Pseudomonas aeruginosa]EIU3319030.1 LysR family transcriptional regulator [Pseudomonas aeruginosa]EIU3437552.1 LysR family transcriptional regulator [Pseudomonas aeruginosa]